MKPEDLSLEEVREYLDYSPDTGLFRWKKTTSNRAVIGDIAGCVNRIGYWHIGWKRKWRLAHRLAWWMHYGEWPEMHVDHINGKRIDNRIANLRIATNSQNLMNAKLFKTNKTGFKGVSWSKAKNKWVVMISHEKGKRKFLGYFENKADAVETSIRARQQYYGEFSQFHNIKSTE